MADYLPVTDGLTAREIQEEGLAVEVRLNTIDLRHGGDLINTNNLFRERRRIVAAKEVPMEGSIHYFVPFSRFFHSFYREIDSCLENWDRNQILIALFDLQYYKYLHLTLIIFYNISVVRKHTLTPLSFSRNGS